MCDVGAGHAARGWCGVGSDAPVYKGTHGSIPVIGVRKRLKTIEGIVPDPVSVNDECPFAARCDEKRGDCYRSTGCVEIRPGHHVWCGALTGHRLSETGARRDI
ncbi:MAG: hypothetical protein HPY55_01885 [Firmicutes bacterium]|nr:hypothetical protein [Bacillota bacterium]